MRYLLVILLALLASVADAKPKTVQTLLIVEATQQAEAEAAIVKVCGPKARGTFVPGVAREGAGKKVYYVANGSWMTAEQLTAFSERLKAHVSAKKVQVFEVVKGREKLKELKIEKVKVKK